MFQSESNESSSDNEYDFDEAKNEGPRGEGPLQQPSPNVEDSPSADIGTADAAKASKRSVPLQKRRRVTRACDECRRKKIKCDGKQPCTHCTVYSYG